MRKTIAVIGYVLIGLVVLQLFVAVLVAARDGQAFYGENYKGLALGTYSALALFVIAALVGAVRLVQIVLARMRLRRSESEG